MTDHSRPGFPISSRELPILHPFQQRVGRDRDLLGGFLDVAMGEQRHNRRFLRPSELCAVSFHLAQPDAICRNLRAPSPDLRQRRFILKRPCLSSTSE
jgi:hypothetical protein